MENKLKHLAIILDGNRRWAKEKGKSSFFGHQEGTEAVKRVLDACLKFNIKHLTVYAFSTENWKRSQEEVGYLMELAMKNIGGGVDYFNKRDIRLRIFGEFSNLSEKLATAFKDTEEKTRHNKSLQFNLCFNYGGRREIICAVKKIIQDNKKVEDIDEDLFASYLYSTGQPDPDIIVRAGGEQRLSNFLMWQSAYSELYFPKIYWPDFNEQTILNVIKEFKSRQRRFGK